MPETTLTWLGHATFRFDTPAGKRVYIDPFLHGNPKCPESELEPERIDVIALTHGHGDHLGDTVDLAKKHGCTVIAPVEMADWLHPYQDQVQRLTEVPGLGVDSAQQIVAEVGAIAAVFPSEKHLSSWVGACPGDNQSAGVNYSHRSPKGNRNMRRILNQAANAAVKAKGMIFEVVYRRTVPRLGHKQTIGAIAHRQCRLIWKILHDGVRYEERGPAVSKGSKQRRAGRMIRELRSLGYRVELQNPQQPNPA